MAIQEKQKVGVVKILALTKSKSNTKQGFEWKEEQFDRRKREKNVENTKLIFFNFFAINYCSKKPKYDIM